MRWFESSYSSAQNGTVRTALGSFYLKCTAYDSQGRKWVPKGIECPYKRSWWTLLLANTGLYNPRTAFTVLWHAPKSYEFQELKLLYTQFLEKDQDFFRNTFDVDELKKRISQAQSFDDLAEAYKWMNRKMGSPLIH